MTARVAAIVDRVSRRGYSGDPALRSGLGVALALALREAVLQHVDDRAEIVLLALDDRLQLVDVLAQREDLGVVERLGLSRGLSV